MIRFKPSSQVMLHAALVLSIPAFYLVLAAPAPAWRYAGSVMYGLMALCLVMHVRRAGGRKEEKPTFYLDLGLLLGAIASTWPLPAPVSEVEWYLRAIFSGLVFLRIVMTTVGWLIPKRLLHTIVVGAVLLGGAGAGFYWMEPKILTYADGLWLAFITAATVGYGDLVPSTPAARIFAVFIVFLGYALFSIVTASIAALFIGEDEKRIQRELHADIRELRGEIAVLREEMRRHFAAREK